MNGCCGLNLVPDFKKIIQEGGRREGHIEPARHNGVLEHTLTHTDTLRHRAKGSEIEKGKKKKKV